MDKSACQLVNESAFDFLPSVCSGTVDLVLTDPPYLVSRNTNFSSGEPTGRDTDRFRVSMDFGTWDQDFDGLERAVSECCRVLKNGGAMVCFYDLWKIGDLKRMMELAGFRQIRFIEWIKTNPVPLNSKVNYLTNAREAAVVGVKGTNPVFHSEYDNGIYSYPICHEEGRFHPTQKPLALFKDIVAKHSNRGDLVLDCFSGSGTAAAASLLLGRRFIGCEISREFWQKSIDRINKIELNGTLNTFIE